MTMLASPVAPVKSTRLRRTRARAAVLATLDSVTFIAEGRRYTAQPMRTVEGVLGRADQRSVAYSVEAEEGPGRDAHIVERGWDGLVRCTCDEWTQREGLSVEPCRVGRALVELRLLRAPNPFAAVPPGRRLP
jgi:hypothetical protein